MELAASQEGMDQDLFRSLTDQMPMHQYRKCFGMTDRQFAYLYSLLKSWGWKNEYDPDYVYPKLFSTAVATTYQNRP